MEFPPCTHRASSGWQVLLFSRPCKEESLAGTTASILGEGNQCSMNQAFPLVPLMGLGPGGQTRGWGGWSPFSGTFSG